MSDQRRFKWQSGRLVSTPLTDFFALGRAPVLTLPLEGGETAYADTRPIVITPSANIAAGGENTTAYGLTAPSGKTSSDFFTGRRWDDENGVDSLTLTADDWTKIGWSIKLNSNAAPGTEYEFRLVADGIELNTYTVVPKITVVSSGVTGTLTVSTNNDLSSFSGTTTILGTFTRTLDNSTLTASGSVGNPVSGTFSVSIVGDTLTSSGTTTVLGTFNRSLFSDTLSGAGTTTVVGTLTQTLSVVVISSTGTTTIRGTASPTTGLDVLNASGSVGSAISGTFSPNTGNDISTISGTTTVRGTLSYILSNNIITSSGNTTILGSLTNTLNNDTITASGFPGAASPVSTWRTLTNVGP